MKKEKRQEEGHEPYNELHNSKNLNLHRIRPICYKCSTPLCCPKCDKEFMVR